MWGSIGLTIIFLFLNAIFSSAEIAVLSFNDVKLKKLKEEGNKKAAKLSKLTEQPAKFLATIQVAITLAGFLNSAFAADNFSGPMADGIMKLLPSANRSTVETVSVVLVTLILSYFSIVLGELVPKRVAMVYSEKLALLLAGLLSAVSKVCAPIVWLLTVSTNAVLRLIGIDPNQAEEEVSEEEIRMMLSEGNEQGTIDSSETELIENVFDFDDTPLEELCTHRIDVTCLDYEDSLEEWNAVINTTRFTYYPIYQDSIDNIIGVLDTKDYFRNDLETKDEVLKNAVDKPWFVSEKETASELFTKMKSSRTYFAILMDEYGGMRGIITIHDLVESIVGDIYEEEEIVTYPDILKVNETTYHVQGDALLDDVADELDVELPVDDFDTFNGLICDVIGRIPNDGESFTCQYNNLNIQVNDVSHHCVQDTIVTIEVKETEEETEKED